ncbi:uncharacterized protein LOC127813383 isoform X2 [Diospyros lotus]|uniref:uncharacterized protein LOC127813383 isoform X2 n=1 Tax=Diospyros lotus TaxID=55363 RepID=UPI00225A968C|nr:uncharacterized protein LOC127813383 isoform X2 [Diospyros lotus]
MRRLPHEYLIIWGPIKLGTVPLCKGPLSSRPRPPPLQTWLAPALLHLSLSLAALPSLSVAPSLLASPSLSPLAARLRRPCSVDRRSLPLSRSIDRPRRLASPSLPVARSPSLAASLSPSPARRRGGWLAALAVLRLASCLLPLAPSLAVGPPLYGNFFTTIITICELEVIRSRQRTWILALVKPRWPTKHGF